MTLDTASGGLLSVIDISNLNSGWRNLAQYQAASGLIVQAIPRPAPNGVAGDQLRQGAADGKKLAVYSWLWNDPSWRMASTVEEDQRRRWATVPSDVVLHGRPWIDTEDNQSAGWRGVSVAQRKDDLQRAFDVADTFAAQRGLPPAGIYWSRFYIDLLYGGWQPDGRVQWRADYGPGTHPHPGSIIGDLVVGHQFTSRPIDQSMFLASEFAEDQGMARIPQEYVDKFHLSSDQDIDGLISNYEGVITTVRQLAIAEGEASAADAVAKLGQIQQVLAAA